MTNNLSPADIAVQWLTAEAVDTNKLAACIKPAAKTSVASRMQAALQPTASDVERREWVVKDKAKNPNDYKSFYYKPEDLKPLTASERLAIAHGEQMPRFPKGRKFK